MGREVFDKGKYSDLLHAYTIVDDRLVSRVYVGVTRSKIIVRGYPMRAALVTLLIDYDYPTDEDIKKLLKLKPIELIVKYRPKIGVDLIIPQLHNYIKMYTYGSMLFVVFEYRNGYVVVDGNGFRIGMGKIPLFNDDIYDFAITMYNTKKVNMKEVVYAIDEARDVMTFYALV